MQNNRDVHNNVFDLFFNNMNNSFNMNTSFNISSNSISKTINKKIITKEDGKRYKITETTIRYGNGKIEKNIYEEVLP